MLVFPNNFGPQKRNLVGACRAYIDETCFKEEHCTGQMECHTGKLTVTEFFVMGKSWGFIHTT